METSFDAPNYKVRFTDENEWQRKVVISTLGFAVDKFLPEGEFAHILRLEDGDVIEVKLPPELNVRRLTTSLNLALNSKPKPQIPDETKAVNVSSNYL